MKDYESAFPVFEEARARPDGTPCTDYVLTSPSMTLCRYAAIKLKVPLSGDPELDAIIREGRRADFVEQVSVALIGDTYIDGHIAANMAEQAFNVANAMLVEWEKEAMK